MKNKKNKTKTCVDHSYLFECLYSRKVAETIKTQVGSYILVLSNEMQFFDVMQVTSLRY